ncbi:MAG: ABC transporter ATP-binding protein [Terriglobia bacterium]|jgi:ATP-binding cassette subfamily B protein
MADSFHDEEILGKAYDARLMRRLLVYLRPYWRMTLFALVAILLFGILQAVPPYLLKVEVDRYLDPAGRSQLPSFLASFLSHNPAVGIAQIVFALLLPTVVLTFGLELAQSFAMQLVGQQVMYDMRKQLFAHLQRLQMSFFDRNPVGRLVTRVTTDVDVLNDLFASGVVALFGDVFSLISIVVVMLKLDWKLAFLTFSVLPVIVVVTGAFRKAVRESYRRIRVAIARINAYLQEQITGMAVVQLFNREDISYQGFEKINRSHMEAYKDSILAYGLFYPAVDLLGTVAVGIILYLGGGMALRNLVTIGTAIAFIQYSQRFFRPIQDLSDKYNLLQAAMASSERIFKLLDMPVTITDQQAPVSVAGLAQSEALRSGEVGGSLIAELRSAPASAPPVVGVPPVGAQVPTDHGQLTTDGVEQVALSRGERVDRDGAFTSRRGPGEGSLPEGSATHTAPLVNPLVEFRQVGFAYKDDHRVLENVSFSVGAGETVAVVGHTGAGKTTLTNLLLRFYDVQDGQVLFDGVDIRQLRLRDLRKNFGIVLQDPFLFSGTISSNIRLGSGWITDRQVRDAARQVNLLEFIEGLPGGFQEPVKERGATLSVGQKQLLSFARALAHNPRILILDEATSSVDPETEHLLREGLRCLIENRTSLVIAHRLSTIQNASKIVVMHKGRVREVGTHHELLQKRGIYFKLYQLQYKDQEVPVVRGQ